MDIYLDDDGRPSWDTMITRHDVLEHGDFSLRQQVVRWIRKFPFAFLSDREYIIARRMYRQGDNLYGISKVRIYRYNISLCCHTLQIYPSCMFIYIFTFAISFMKYVQI